jgi:hypothetical protein
MGRPAGRFTGGSRSDQILATLAEGPLKRRHIVVKTRIDPRPLGIALARLIRQQKVVLAADGLHHLAVAAPVSPPVPQPSADNESFVMERAPPSVPAHLRQLVDACIRRAHVYREQGRREDAAFLLRRAAGAWGLRAFPAIAADLLALADLFAAHGTIYPELDLRRAT